MTKHSFAALALAALTAAACNSTSSGDDAGAEAGPPVDAGGPAPPAVVTGIPECDDLIARYDACLAKNPELKKKEYMLVNARKASLTIQATSPDARESTANRCRVLFEGPLKANCPQ